MQSLHSDEVSAASLQVNFGQTLRSAEVLYNECSQWWDSGETPGEGNKTPLARDVSEKHRQEGTANSTGLVVTCGWGFPEPQSTFCSSFITLQTRVIHRPHVWWLWQPEIKNKLWFFPVAKVIVPSAHRLRTRAHETTVWVKACLLLKWPANSLQPTVIWFPWIHRGRATRKNLACWLGKVLTDESLAATAIIFKGCPISLPC